jgi:hypothetical protein
MTVSIGVATQSRLIRRITPLRVLMPRSIALENVGRNRVEEEAA